MNQFQLDELATQSAKTRYTGIYLFPRVNQIELFKHPLHEDEYRWQLAG